MRFSYALALILTMTIGVTYWYQTTRHICPVPIAYRLASIDESFSITEAEALAAIEAATALWEEETGVDLFVYDEAAELSVSFIFDDRQATADAQANDQARLDAVQSRNEEIRASIETLQGTYETMQGSFEVRKAAYDEALEIYNTKVRQANDRGGATPEEFAALQAEQAELEAESRALRTLANELNSVAAQLNELSAEGNRLVNSYNREVNQYNSRYSAGEAFTQGDFTGTEIHIYKFSDTNELVAVLAHEFGHALTIDHVEDEASLMYYLLQEGGDKEPQLTNADLAAYEAVCQMDTWDFKLRSIIRSIIS